MWRGVNMPIDAHIFNIVNTFDNLVLNATIEDIQKALAILNKKYKVRR